MDTLAECYYDKLQDYMVAIFQLTTDAIQSSNDNDVKVAAIEFWSTVALQEQTLIDEERDYEDSGLQLDRQACPRYVFSALERLVPLLLQTLTQQAEDLDDDDHQTLQTYGGVCLESLSATVEGDIVKYIVPFVESNIQNENWRLRDAAIVAFTCMLDGPSTDVVGSVIARAMPVILMSFNDPHPIVRDSATSCIAKVMTFHIIVVTPEQLNQTIHCLIQKLGEQPKLATHACYALYGIAKSCKPDDGQQQETNILSPPMLPLLQALLTVADRDDAIESNLRISAFSSAAELISVGGRDVNPVFRDFLPVVIQRIDAALKIQVISNDDKEQKEQLLGLLCGVCTAIFQRLEKQDIVAHVDHVMELLIQVLQVRNATCHEEAYLTAGAIAGTLEEDFLVRF
jgi:importin subunit beta-1